MPQATTKRTRACTPRSTTGCANCRRRRIKCGEELPSCHRCRYSGWQCPGYSTRPGQSEGGNDDSLQLQKRASRPEDSRPRQPSISEYALPFKVPGGRHERRALHYYTLAAPEMGGLLPSEFWSRSILQRCQDAAPLRHAAAALGELYVEYVASEEDFTPSDAAMQGYGRAVKSLRHYIGANNSPSRELVLMCSAIFFCCELLRGERVAANAHVENGLQILRQWQDSDGARPSIMANGADELLMTFARMDLEASLIDDARMPVLRVAVPKRNKSGSTSLGELYTDIFLLVHSALVFLARNVPYKDSPINEIPGAHIDDRMALVRQFEEWEAAASRFEQSAVASSPLRFVQRGTIAICRCHSGVTGLLVRHAFNDDVKAASPSFGEEAARLLHLAEHALAEPAQSSRPLSSRGRRFSPHTGLIIPLYVLVVKLSDPDLRETALNLLRRCSGSREAFVDADDIVQSIEGLVTRARDLDIPTGSIRLEWILHQNGQEAKWSDSRREALQGNTETLSGYISPPEFSMWEHLPNSVELGESADTVRS